MKCKLGDFAVIIKEDPGCESNIGALVLILEKATDWEHCDWVVYPVDRDLVCLDEENKICSSTSVDAIECPDDHLVPTGRSINNFLILKETE